MNKQSGKSRRLALLLSVVMLIGLLSGAITVSAYDNTTDGISATRANISYIYLGTSAGTGNTNNILKTNPNLAPQTIPTDFAPTSTTVIWIGLQLSNLSAVRDMLKSDRTVYTTAEEGGLYNIVGTVAYNSTYLQPAVTTAGPLYNAVKPNYMVYDTDNGEAVDSHYKCEQANGSTTVSGLNNGEDMKVDPAAVKYFQINMSLDSDNVSYATDPRVLFDDPQSDPSAASGTLGDDPIVLIAFPFKLATGKSWSDITAASAAGTLTTPLVQGMMGPTSLKLNIGFGGANIVYNSWDKNRGTSATQNLKNYFDATNADGSAASDGVIKLLPAAATPFTATINVKVDDVAADNGDVKVVEAGGALTSASAASKTSTGVYSFSCPNDEKSYDVYVGADKVGTASKTSATVTADYYTVNFTAGTAADGLVSAKKGSTNVANGTKVLKGTALTFTATKGTAHGNVSTYAWSGTGVTNSAKNTLNYTVNAKITAAIACTFTYTPAGSIAIAPTGSQQVGTELTATPTITNAEGGHYTIKWYHKGSENGTPLKTSAQDAATDTYTIVAGDAGKTIVARLDFGTVGGKAVFYSSNEVAATLKSAPAAPDLTGVTATGCTTAANNDGKISGVQTTWEYVKSASKPAASATGTTCGATELTGLTNGKYWFRVKATPDTAAGAWSATGIDVAAYVAPGQSPVPSITTQPADAAVKTGETASFTVATDGSNPTYQWQVKAGNADWANIDAATSATYTTAAVTAEMDGYQYRCLVKQTVGGNTESEAATSDAAKLTVKSQPTLAVEAAAGDGKVTLTVKPTLNNNEASVITGYSITAMTGELPLAWEKNEDGTLKKEDDEGNAIEATLPEIKINGTALTADDFEVDDTTGAVTLKFPVAVTPDANGKIEISGLTNDKPFTFTVSAAVTGFDAAEATSPAVTPKKPSVSGGGWLPPVKDEVIYMRGYTDGTFRPNAYLKRSEVATIVAQLSENFRDDVAYTCNFSDVKAGEWYYSYVAFAAEAGILNGYPDGSFRPDANITRAELAKVIAAFAGLADNAANGFGDTAGHWANGYIGALRAKGAVEGYPDGSFRPENAVTRAEAVKMVNAVLDRTPEGKMVEDKGATSPFYDVHRADWFYYEVIEASVAHKVTDFHK